jgi:hypothetical protein
VVHFKSKFGGNDAKSQAKRRDEATRVAAIYQAHRAAGISHIASMGDFNDTPEEAAAAVVLDALHGAASRADGATYFDLFTPDATYIGTDVTEHWSIAEFRAYAEPYFNRGRGWTYTPRSRSLTLAPLDGRCVVWFAEALDSQSYGTSRGTGVLVRGEDGQWRIALYALTFPIPNALARDMTARIRAAAQ